jgi:hypothetical protein
MNTKIQFGKTICREYDMLLDQLAKTQIHTIRTSSIPLAQFWKDTDERLKELSKEVVDLQDHDVTLCFEYHTSSQGRGGASKTDLMLSCGDTEIAIEAKYTEYSKMPEESVSEWLKGGDPENRKQVLAGWWQMIEKFRQNPQQQTSEDIGYQFLHRTASACKDSENAIVIYQLFYDKEDEQQKEDLQEFKKCLKKYVELIGPNDKLKFYTLEVEAKLLRDADTDIKKENPFLLMKNEDIYQFPAQQIHTLQTS